MDPVFAEQAAAVAIRVAKGCREVATRHLCCPSGHERPRIRPSPNSQVMGAGTHWRAVDDPLLRSGYVAVLTVPFGCLNAADGYVRRVGELLEESS